MLSIRFATITLAAALTFAAGPRAFAAYTLTPILVPGSGESTVAEGISGNNIVGYYTSGSFTYGFLYDGAAYHTLQYGSNFFTRAMGVDGNNVVGFTSGVDGDVAFLYDGTSYTPLNVPNPSSPIATGISGSTIVGYNGTDGFIYNGSTYSTLDYPGATATAPMATDGTSIVGIWYDSNSIAHGFTYKGSTFTSIDYPYVNSNPTNFTEALGVDGNLIVGRTYGSDTQLQGYIYDTSTDTYSLFLYPTTGSPFTELHGISDGRITGWFASNPADPSEGSFLATPDAPAVPEPASLTLLALSAIPLLLRKPKTHQKI